jgi:hypothetical protein
MGVICSHVDLSDSQIPLGRGKSMRRDSKSMPRYEESVLKFQQNQGTAKAAERSCFVDVGDQAGLRCLRENRSKRAQILLSNGKEMRLDGGGYERYEQSMMWRKKNNGLRAVASRQNPNPKAEAAIH